MSKDLRGQLEKAARELTQEIGRINLTRGVVCHRAGVPEGSFGYATGMVFGDWIGSLDLPETAHPAHGARLDPEVRKEQIIDTALTLSEKYGYLHVHFEDIAKELEVTTQLVKHYYPTIERVYYALMKKAIVANNCEIIAQGVVNRHPLAMALDTEIKTEAIRAVIEGCTK